MKRFLLLVLIIFTAGPLIIQPAHSACSTDPNSPTILPGFTITAGKTINWRVRAIDSDYGIYGGYVDVVAGSNPVWVIFGPRIAPDVNQYVFAPKNLTCDGNMADPNTTLIVSRQITISPPVIFTGNSAINFSTTDANGISYWRIPFAVIPPPRIGMSGDAGADQNK
ncbi:MAG: hypothetical protein ABSB91_00330 [Sedimentisphaerales bacterium]